MEIRTTGVSRQKDGDPRFQIESKRTGVYRQKVGELDFTDRKQENWSSLLFSICKIQFFHFLSVTYVGGCEGVSDEFT